MRILFASQNKSKKDEISKIFERFSDKYSIYIDDKNIEVDEDQETIEKNAIKKAIEYYKFFKTPVISDDSGLFVDSLDGMPGVFSARFAGENATDEENIKKLLKLMQNRANKIASFKRFYVFIMEVSS